MDEYEYVGSAGWKGGHISVIIAIGANLWSPQHGTPLQTCAWAARQVARVAGLSRPVLSRWYGSAAVPDPAGPRYVNGVMRLDGTPNPAELLATLHRIESEAGRLRSVLNAPRTLDLDILDIAGLRRPAPDPVLPHPRAHLRAFVLIPLRDVAPDWRHPLSGHSVTALLSALPEHDTHPV